MLQIQTVYPATLELLRKLQAIPLFKDLRLVGGTSLALQLGHRLSIDLDLFGHLPAELSEITRQLEEAGLQPTILHNTASIHIFSINGIKTDFVDYPYVWLEKPMEEEGIILAEISDIAAMKLSAITNRGTKKDFIDIYFLLQHYTLQQMLDFYMDKYHNSSIFPVVKSLSYFDDADPDPMPKMLIPVEWTGIKQIITEAVANMQ